MTDQLAGQQLGLQRTTLARRYTESAEGWLRNLVHYKLSSTDGMQYITTGNWSRSLQRSVAGKLASEPERCSREIDATTFGELVKIVCNPQQWPRWSDGLRHAYPDGCEEARTFLKRLVEIRNDVSHGRVCSERQVERAICYSNDLADSIKDYFRRQNMGRDFNVPTFIRCYDNLGNEAHLVPGHHYRISNFIGDDLSVLYPGDLLLAEVEVDPTFSSESYRVEWLIKNTYERGTGTNAAIDIANRHVDEQLELQFKIVTNADWHRSNGYDDAIDLYYRVLPSRQ
ncbi:MAG: hypothetical protein AAF483_24785 [Planctomycetota bacterium]